MQTERELTSSWLGWLSQRCRTRFEGKQMRIRRGATVHHVDWIDGLGGLRFPQPGCHIGTAGFDLEIYVPTDEPVTCNRCLRRSGERSSPLHAAEIPGQLALDLP
ncbi:hypothetical protein FB384_004873 [Prauserella sediminis]|uniref:Uncharacterized protein n=1 Tax=Prauserella sediminis TaxID=577680 RepID=A0A839XX29_9PSEU|nr:hypothetical protein [Prauserella sediminis]MBB3665914.1 hypothetical protein [Prauserella sediminis]